MYQITIKHFWHRIANRGDFLSLTADGRLIYSYSTLTESSRSLHSSTERLLKIQKTNLKTFGECSFGYTAPTVWNSLPADPRASPSLPTFKVNLKMYFFRQAFWLICTCQSLPVSFVCVCVSWGQGWGLGGMELRVGSNIMIYFLYVLLLLIRHMDLYIIHC